MSEGLLVGMKLGLLAHCSPAAVWPGWGPLLYTKRLRSYDCLGFEGWSGLSAMKEGGSLLPKISSHRKLPLFTSFPYCLIQIITK